MPPATLPAPADVLARTLYLHESVGATSEAGPYPAPADVDARSLYLYVNEAVYGHPAGGETLGPDDVQARSLYLYVSEGLELEPADTEARTLYTFEAYTNGELFPWIEKIAPTEALPGQQIAIYGDGFGDTPAAEGGIVRLGSPVDVTTPGPGAALGVVTWQTRSPGLYPANSGIPTEPAIIATVPDPADSGMVSVEETT